MSFFWLLYLIPNKILEELSLHKTKIDSLLENDNHQETFPEDDDVYNDNDTLNKLEKKEKEYVSFATLSYFVLSTDLEMYFQIFFLFNALLLDFSFSSLISFSIYLALIIIIYSYLADFKEKSAVFLILDALKIIRSKNSLKNITLDEYTYFYYYKNCLMRVIIILWSISNSDHFSISFSILNLVLDYFFKQKMESSLNQCVYVLEFIPKILGKINLFIQITISQFYWTYFFQNVYSYNSDIVFTIFKSLVIYYLLQFLHFSLARDLDFDEESCSQMKLVSIRRNEEKKEIKFNPKLKTKVYDQQKYLVLLVWHIVQFQLLFQGLETYQRDSQEFQAFIDSNLISFLLALYQVLKLGLIKQNVLYIRTSEKLRQLITYTLKSKKQLKRIKSIFIQKLNVEESCQVLFSSFRKKEIYLKDFNRHFECSRTYVSENVFVVTFYEGFNYKILHSLPNPQSILPEVTEIHFPNAVENEAEDFGMRSYMEMASSLINLSNSKYPIRIKGSGPSYKWGFLHCFYNKLYIDQIESTIRHDLVLKRYQYAFNVNIQLVLYDLYEDYFEDIFAMKHQISSLKESFFNDSF